MKVDFFQTNCQSVINALIFGIRDDSDNAPAYVDIAHKEMWVATIKNDDGVEITFTALDKCIQFLRENGDEDKRCDVMLTYQKEEQYMIIFIELKEATTGGSIKDAQAQLEASIKNFQENHNFDMYHKKKAFICNKRHPNFQVVANELQQRFYQTYKVRLDINTVITI